MFIRNSFSTHRKSGKNYFELSVHRLKRPLNNPRAPLDQRNKITSNNKLRRKSFGVCTNDAGTIISFHRNGLHHISVCCCCFFSNYMLEINEQRLQKQIAWNEYFRLRNIQVNVYVEATIGFWLLQPFRAGDYNTLKSFLDFIHTTINSNMCAKLKIERENKTSEFYTCSGSRNSIEMNPMKLDSLVANIWWYFYPDKVTRWSNITVNTLLSALQQWKRYSHIKHSIFNFYLTY